MCLLTKKGKMQTATEDMVCYKVLACHPKDGTYYSPYQQDYEWDVKTKKVFVDRGRIRKQRVKSVDGNPNYVGIGGGVFHVFKNPDDAVKFWSELRGYWCAPTNWGDWHNPIAFVIARCVIPKGTKYYYGRTQSKLFMPVWKVLENGYESYAAKKIKIIEITK